MTGQDLWPFRETEHRVTPAADLLAGRVNSAFVSLGSLHDPAKSAHTATLLTVVEPDLFSAWAAQPWMRRGARYTEVKQRIVAGLLDLLELWDAAVASGGERTRPDRVRLAASPWAVSYWPLR